MIRLVSVMSLALGLIACGDDGGGGDSPDARVAIADASQAGPDAAAVDAPAIADGAAADGPVVVPDAAVADAAPGPDAAPTTLTFQQDVSGYISTQDSSVQSASPSSNFGTLSVFAWDGDPTSVGLLQFGAIFGSAGDQIPPGATIVSATLTLQVDNGSDAAGTIHLVTSAWSEGTVTWATQPTYDASSLADAPFTTGAHVIDVTTSLATWSASPASNFGWAFATASADGVAVRPSEGASAQPLLSVTYVSP